VIVEEQGNERKQHVVLEGYHAHDVTFNWFEPHSLEIVMQRVPGDELRFSNQEIPPGLPITWREPRSK
jgi:hypothetical protein